MLSQYFCITIRSFLSKLFTRGRRTLEDRMSGLPIVDAWTRVAQGKNNTMQSDSPSIISIYVNSFSVADPDLSNSAQRTDFRLMNPNSDPIFFFISMGYSKHVT